MLDRVEPIVRSKRLTSADPRVRQGRPAHGDAGLPGALPGAGKRFLPGERLAMIGYFGWMIIGLFFVGLGLAIIMIHMPDAPASPSSTEITKVFE
jgi:hypothetical protein